MPSVRTPSKYMPALDGLRAFAVITVIIYHMNATVLPSGLLGVTVFFVLSGYLITGLLFKEWRETHKINLPQFWLRRVRRLIPAIVFMLVSVLALTAIFSPEMLTKLRNDLVAALLFVTNWWFIFQDQSYFEVMGAPSPVTHFWSLAIEEQFYIIWPPLLLLLFSFKVRRKNLQRGILIASVISALAMALLYNPLADPSRVYYGTDTRAFSLLIGAWLAFEFPPERIRGQGRRPLDGRARTYVHWAGIAAFIGILLLMEFTNGYSPFLYRGGIYLLSVLTAVLIVSLVDETSIISKIFALKPFVWIGQRSYGIYLWHYPLLLLMNPRNFTGEIPWYIYLGEMAVVFAVAAFSYHFIENPIRHGAIGRFILDVRSGKTSVSAFLTQHKIQVACSVVLVGVAVIGSIVVPPTSNKAAELFEARGETTPAPDAAVTTNEEGYRGLWATLYGVIPPEEMFDTSLSPEERAENTDMLIIGDSVVEGIGLYGYFDSRFPNATINAVLGRQLYTGKELYAAEVEAGWNGPVVIFELGSNGVATKDQVEEMIASVPEGKTVFICNVRTPEALQDINNQLFQEAIESHDNVHLIDWYGASAGHDEYFDGDGTHLTPAGCDAYLNLIRERVADVLYR